MPGAGHGRRELSREPLVLPAPPPTRLGSLPRAPAGARCGDVRAEESHATRGQVLQDEEEGIRKNCGYSFALKFSAAGVAVLYGLSPQMDTKFLLIRKVSLFCPTFRGADAVLLCAERQFLGNLTKQMAKNRQAERQRPLSTAFNPQRPSFSWDPVVYLAEFLTNHKHLFVGKTKQNSRHTHTKIINYRNKLGSFSLCQLTTTSKSLYLSKGRNNHDLKYCQAFFRASI